MAIMNVDIVQATLEREIPEFRTGGGSAALWSFCGAASILIVLSCGLYAFSVSEPGPVGFLVVAGLTLALSYAIGSFTYNSETVLGADIAEEAAEDYNRAWLPGSRDRAAEEMQFGMALMAFQFLFGAVYGAVEHMKKQGAVVENDRADLAARMVHHILVNGRTTQDALFASSELQKFELAELRATLALLNKTGVLESRADGGMWIAPPKKYLFD